MENIISFSFLDITVIVIAIVTLVILGYKIYIECMPYKLKKEYIKYLKRLGREED